MQSNSIIIKLSKIIFPVLVAIVLNACQSNEIPQFDAGNIKDKPEQSVSNIEVNFVDSTFRKATLFADSAFVYNEHNYTMLRQNIKVLFYSKENHKLISTLTADSVRIEDRSKDMIAYGNVVVKTDAPSSTILETSELLWNNIERKIYTKSFVKITSPNEVLQGYGFESDDKLSYYKIYKVIGEQK